MKNKSKKYDFSGYATKNDIKCTDGRTIRKDAFKENDGQTVPLVWHHLHDDPINILGHAVLENRDDGVYAYCTFNDTDKAKTAKVLVEHGDITAMSIHANQLEQKGNNVLHGVIREVSLVLAGANRGAFIDNLGFEHSDGTKDFDDTEAIISSGEDISLENDDVEHGDSGSDKTIQDVFDTFTDEQKNVVYAMLAHALDTNTDNGQGDKKKVEHSDYKGGDKMKKNIFDKKDNEENKTTLTHDQFAAIKAEALKCGSLKEAFLSHVQTYGIENIDILFPDAKTVTPTPDYIQRKMEWVGGIINGTTHTPFSRIKSTAADITADDARARGYVKGNLKKEEVVKLLKRVTIPTTVYKKQKLDRDDIIDITDLDVVSWLKSEMRMMLDEELARAVLIGDGRAADSDDKINEENIRPIYKDDDMYSHHITIDNTADIADTIEAIIRARKYYKGSGNPNFYTTTDTLTDMLLVKDTTGRRLYSTKAELAAALMVSDIIDVPVMEGITRESTDPIPVTLGLIGIIVNPKDYTIGADKGGQVSMFEDFDIDYNQQKYLIETRCSGALVHPKSALVIEKDLEVAAG